MKLSITGVLSLVAVFLAVVLIVLLSLFGNAIKEAEAPDTQEKPSFSDRKEEKVPDDTQPLTPDETPDESETTTEEETEEESTEPELPDEPNEIEPEDEPKEELGDLPGGVQEANPGDQIEGQPQTPEEKPEESGSSLLGQGTLRSSTGTAINLVTDWSAVTTGSDTAEVKLTVSVESYSLRATEAYGALVITVNGQQEILNMPALAVETQNLAYTQVANRSYTVNIAKGGSANVTIQVDWFFGGSYSGVSLPVITCSGTASLYR